MSALPNVLPFRSKADLKAQADAARAAEGQRKRQIDRAAAVLDRFDARAAAYDREIKRLQARKSIVCRKADAFEERVLGLMSARQCAKLEGVERTLIARPAPLSLIVDDDSRIPGEYLRVKYEAMKAEIKTALARGEQIAGVRLVQRTLLVRK